jgi:hypothetical protein
MMPGTNARGHKVPLGSETSITRETIFEAFGNSIRDFVPVANVTARAQLVADLTAEGEGPTSARPIVVYRHDAPGLHRIEYTTDGTLWLPGSGQLVFADDAARDSWTTSNSGLLVAGDLCVSASLRYWWNGTQWADARGALGIARSSTTQTLVDLTLTTVIFASAAVARGVTFGSNGWTVQRSGEYMLDGYVAYDSDADGRREVSLAINGSTVGTFGRNLAIGSTSRVPIFVSGPLSLSAGDLVQMRALHSAGNSLAITDRHLMIRELT